MAAKSRQQEDFDVSQFLRQDDGDMKSAISSLLRDQPAVLPGADESRVVESVVEDAGGSEVLESKGFEQAAAVPFSQQVEQTESRVQQHIAPAAQSPDDRVRSTTGSSGGGPRKRGISPVDRSFEFSQHLKRARKLFKLNKTETSLYELFLKWTHALGETRCQATNPKLCKALGLEASDIALKRIRLNLRSLADRGLIEVVQPWDKKTHSPAIYEVKLPPLLFSN